MAELLTRQVTFPGNNHIDQLEKILHLVGTPDDEFLVKISSESARKFVSQLPKQPKKDFSMYFKGANPLALNLLECLLTLDPDRRPTAEEALGHPYLELYHEPVDEPAGEPFDDCFETQEKTVEQWKGMIYEEILNFVSPIGNDTGCSEVMES